MTRRPGTVQPPTALDPAARTVVVGTVGGCLTAIGGLGAAFLPPNNPLESVPVIGWLQASAGLAVATVLLISGVAMLFHAWLRLRTELHSVRSLPAVVALWSAPMVLAPPMFSRDAWSYAAQGNLVRMGFDPYLSGPAVLPGRFSEAVDPLWFHTAAPYGPLALQLQRGVVEATSASAYTSAVSMRVIALLGLAVIVFVVPRLAKAINTDPSYAMWLGVLNPLTLLHLVGGIHNDALMVGLMLLGLYLGVRRWHVLGAIAIAAAVAVKAPAAVALGPLGYIWARSLPPWRWRPLLGLAASGVTGLAAFVVITWATGLGFGWLNTLDVPASIQAVLSPPTMLGMVTGGLLQLVGLEGAVRDTVPVTRTVGTVLAVIALAWLMVRRAPDRPVHATALMLLAVALLGPVLHAWYLLWGGIALAITDHSERTRRMLIWATAGLTCYSALDGAFKNGSLALGGSLAVMIGWFLFSRHREHATERTSEQPAAPERTVEYTP
jgi:alpha-1,6-mannosyltransferase